MLLRNLFAASAFTAVAMASTGAAALSFNPATDFSVASNPAGAYTYGYESTLGGALTPFTNAYTGPSYQDWRSPAVDPYLGVYNITSGGILQHPGPSAQDSIIRITLPSSGFFTISGAFSNGDNATTDVHVLVDGVSAFDGAINNPGGVTSSTFSFSRSLGAGDTVDFAVGSGGNGYFNDSTLLSASVVGVPEPASWALMLVGFGGLGVALRGSRRLAYART